MGTFILWVSFLLLKLIQTNIHIKMDLTLCLSVNGFICGRRLSLCYFVHIVYLPWG